MKKVLAFDLDDTLSVTKLPISDQMSKVLSEVLDRLHVGPHQLNRLHLMPTCGTRTIGIVNSMKNGICNTLRL